MTIKLFRWSVMFVLLSAILFQGAGCRQEEVSKIETGKVLETKPAAGLPARPAWEEDWEKTLALGKKEGKIVVYTSAAGQSRIPLAKALAEKYGIDIEWLAGRSSELAQKILLEHRTGLYLVDFFMGGATTLAELNAGGALEPLPPALILPEVKDPKFWLDGTLYFIDKERKIFPYFSRTGSTILINNEMLKPEELKSYRHLLESRWKGKIVINDPTIAGAGNGFIAVLNVLMSEDFLRELARQEPIITRDQRQQVEWVARGKYPILLGPHVDTMEEFGKAGAPIKHMVPGEGTYAGAGGGIIGLISRAPHTAAAKVFLNWFLSREGQSVAVKAALDQSRRVDVSTEFISPDRRLQTGVKYLDGESELMLKKREESMVLAREIFAAQLK